MPGLQAQGFAAVVKRSVISMLAGGLVLAGLCLAGTEAKAEPSAGEAGFSQQKLASSPDSYLVQWKVRNNAVLRALVDAPVKLVAGLILFAGDNGCLGITAQGEQTALTGNFFGAHAQDVCFQWNADRAS